MVDLKIRLLGQFHVSRNGEVMILDRGTSMAPEISLILLRCERSFHPR